MGFSNVSEILAIIDPSNNYLLELRQALDERYSTKRTNPIDAIKEVDGWQGQEDAYLQQWNEKTKSVRGKMGNGEEQHLKYVTETNVTVTDANAKGARELSKLVLGDGKTPNRLITELQKAASKYHFNPTDPSNKEAYNQAVKAVKRQLGDSIGDFVNDGLKEIGDGVTEEAGKEIARNAGRFLDDAKESLTFGQKAIKFMNAGKRANINGLQQKVAVTEDGATTLGPWNSIRSLLRRIPGEIPLSGGTRWGDFLANFGKVEDSSALRMARLELTRHTFQAGDDLLKGQSGMWKNLGKSMPLLKTYLAEGGKDLLGNGVKGFFKKATSKLFGIAAPAVVGMGLAKAPGMFGQMARTFLDFTYAPGAGDAAAKGDIGALTGYAAEHLLLTGATALVGAAGVTGALAAIIPGAPIIGAIAAGAAVFATVSAVWGGVKWMSKNTFGGGNGNSSNIAQIPNQGGLPNAAAPVDMKQYLPQDLVSGLQSAGINVPGVA